MLSIGSVCLQIAPMEDGTGDTWPVGESARCGVRWSNTLKGADGDLVIDYGVPTVLDWSSGELEPQPLVSIVTHFNVRTTEGWITPVFLDARG